MNYLLFRTDRIGDFLITLPIIKSIKRNNQNSKIYIVGSEKNFLYLKKNYLIHKVFLLKSNNLIGKLMLCLELKKYIFDVIIISDKKNRSIFISFFLKAKKKIFNVSRFFQKKILNIFYKDVFLDNDTLVNRSIGELLKDNCNAMGISLKKEDFNYFKIDQFKKDFLLSNLIKLDNLDFVVFHYDEKWEINNYRKMFKKASNYTDINTDYKKVIKFLSNLAIKTSKKIIITTGTLDTRVIEDLKRVSIQLNEFIYEINLFNTKAFLLTDQNFYSISHLISKSKLLISCHGAFTHIASNYNIKILDIIEKNKKNHYSRITKNMNNHKQIYRDKFTELSQQIISYS